MISRFDHAVIAVKSIPEALEAYAAIGFEVHAGGRHPSIGTQNAIVRFGLDYLELLAVEDDAQARESGPFGRELAEFLQHSSGLVGFVLASADLDQQSRGLKKIAQAHVGPFAMDRERPDGRMLAWRLVIPGDSPWRKPWPFLIQWETPDAERIAWDAPGTHRNGALGVAGLELLVDDLPGARQFYEQGLGLKGEVVSERAVDYRLGDFCLTVSSPGNEQERDEVARLGPGPHRLLLRTGPGRAGDLALEAALGARIRLVDDSAA